MTAQTSQGIRVLAPGVGVCLHTEVAEPVADHRPYQFIAASRHFSQALSLSTTQPTATTTTKEEKDRKKKKKAVSQIAFIQKKA